jgi:hypothetical protein
MCITKAENQTIRESKIMFLKNRVAHWSRSKMNVHIEVIGNNAVCAVFCSQSQVPSPRMQRKKIIFGAISKILKETTEKEKIVD